MSLFVLELLLPLLHPAAVFVAVATSAVVVAAAAATAAVFLFLHHRRLLIVRFPRFSRSQEIQMVVYLVLCETKPNNMYVLFQTRLVVAPHEIVVRYRARLSYVFSSNVII